VPNLPYELENGVLSKLHPNEPIFVLRANDPLALSIVTFYADFLKHAGDNPSKVISAEACARSFKDWKKI